MAEATAPFTSEQALSPYPYDTHFVEPEPALPLSSPDVITPEQLARWKSTGFLFLTGVWPDELIQRAAAESLQVYPQPPPHDVDAASRLAVGNSFESGRGMETFFPSLAVPATNEVTMHPRNWRLQAQLLGTEDLRLVEAAVIAKYGAEGQQQPWDQPHGAVTGDQFLHQD